MGVVTPLGDPETHFWLTRSMGRKMGLSLGEAMAEGRLSPEAYADMVTRCRTCAHVAECQSWLAQSQKQQEAPGFCAHAHLMQHLRQGAAH